MQCNVSPTWPIPAAAKVASLDGQCQNFAEEGADYCRVHGGKDQAPARTPEAVPLDQGAGRGPAGSALGKRRAEDAAGRGGCRHGAVGAAAEPGGSDAEFLAAYPEVEKSLKTARRLEEGQFLPGTEVRRDALAGQRVSRCSRKSSAIIVDELAGVRGLRADHGSDHQAESGRPSNTRATRKPTRHESRLVSVCGIQPAMFNETRCENCWADDQDHCDRRRPANVHTMVNSSRESERCPCLSKTRCPRRDQGR